MARTSPHSHMSDPLSQRQHAHRARLRALHRRTLSPAVFTTPQQQQQQQPQGYPAHQQQHYQIPPSHHHHHHNMCPEPSGAAPSSPALDMLPLHLRAFTISQARHTAQLSAANTLLEDIKASATPGVPEALQTLVQGQEALASALQDVTKEQQRQGKLLEDLLQKEGRRA